MADKSKKDAAPAKKGGGGSSNLDIGGFGRGLKLFMLWGLLPLAALTWCLVTWDGGPALRNSLNDERWRHIGFVVGGVGLITVAWWLCWPLGQWLRSSSWSAFASGNKFLMSFTLLGALPFWLACYAAFLGGLALGGWAIWQGLRGLGFDTLVRSAIG